MARPSGPKTRCGGKWTEAKFKSFIKNNLRSSTRKWEPIQLCKKRAHVARGEYKCEGCGNIVPPTIYDEDSRKRVTNIFVDHIDPIIDPAKGFVSWDETIDRMFCEIENLQLLCRDCHSVKSQKENAIAKQRRKDENE